MSRFQLFGFILQTQIGIGVLAFPYELHKAAGVDGWISLLLTGGVIQLLLLAYVALCERFPKRNLFEFAPLLLGKWFGNLVTILYIVHFALISCIVLLLEMVLVQLWIFPYSNLWLIIVANGVILIYFSKESIRIIARYHTMISFILIIMVGLLFIGLDNLDYRYMLPIGQQGWQALITGMKSSIFSFLGFELLLVVSSDVKRNGKSLIAPMLWANGVAAAFYFIVVIVCYLNFSPEAISHVPEPVPFYLNGISLAFVERLDLLFLSIWLVKVTATLTSYVYATGKGVGYLFHRNQHNKAIYYVVPLVCLSGFFYKWEPGIEYLSTFIEVESYVVLGLPIVLLLVALLTGRKEDQLA